MGCLVGLIGLFLAFSPNSDLHLIGWLLIAIYLFVPEDRNERPQ